MLKPIFRAVTLIAILGLALSLSTPARPAQATGTLACPSDCKVYLPLIQRSCGNTGQSFGQWPRGAGYPPNSGFLPEQHPDLNLIVRGYGEVTGRTLGLVVYGGNPDPNAPQLDGLLNRGVPVITKTYQVKQAPWDPQPGQPITNPDVTMIGFQVNTDELVRAPASGYDIGGGYEVRVLYAASNRITFVYTTRDDVVDGYTIQVENVCIDPNLVNLYNQLNAAGRNNMPALVAGQPFGTAISPILMVTIRDKGSYLDPRSKNDWWKNY